MTRLEASSRNKRSPSDRIAAVIAGFCGSMTFVWVHVAWFTLWIGLNTLPVFKPFDPFPFTFLTLVVSLEAIFLSTFILISQNADNRLTEKRHELDLQINLLAEKEATKILHILALIAEKLEVPIADDGTLTKLEEDINPESILQQIEAAKKGRKES